MSIKQDLENALTKIEELPAEIAADVKAGIHDLLSKLHLAEGKAEAQAAEGVKEAAADAAGAVEAASHNVDDVAKKDDEAVAGEAHEAEKQVDRAVEAVTGTQAPAAPAEAPAK